jgi:hypothetical protein
MAYETFYVVKSLSEVLPLGVECNRTAADRELIELKCASLFDKYYASRKDLGLEPDGYIKRTIPIEMSIRPSFLLQ